MTFSDKIKRAREVVKLTQSKLSQLVGVSQRTIASYESGGAIARRSTISKLAKALRVSVKYLSDETCMDPMTEIEKDKNIAESHQLYGGTGACDMGALLRENTESYTINGDNMRVWDAKGNDIYCQGNIQKELPVGLSVSYKLDGKAISPDELARKNGRVTIRFDYQNNQFKMVEIDGNQEKIYVPFVMLTGMLLDSDVFTDVEVTNGKIINDGERIAVLGIAFPALQSNLMLDTNKITIPDYVEITAQVKNFEMTNTVTIATNEIFNRLNTDKLDSIDDLTNSLDELNGAMGQLMNGSSKLYDGLCTLFYKSGELVDVINKLATGVEKLQTGSGDLKSGSSALAGGAKELSNGLGELVKNNGVLNAGSKQVFDSLLSMANSQISAAGLSVPELTIQNYAEVLNGIIADLDETGVAKRANETVLKTVTESVNAQKEVITAGVTDRVREGVTKKSYRSHS